MRIPAIPSPPPARPTGRPLKPPPPPAPRASITSCDPPPRFQRMARGTYGLTERSAAIARRQPALRAGTGLAVEAPRVRRVLEVLGDRGPGPAGEDAPQDPTADQHEREHADDDRQGGGRPPRGGRAAGGG